MDRVRRWANNILCGLSLLIFLLAMGIWVRSYFAEDRLMRVSAYSGTDVPGSRYTLTVRNTGAESRNGRIDFFSMEGAGWQPIEEIPRPMPGKARWMFESHPSSLRRILSWNFRFAVYREAYSDWWSDHTESHFFVPLWLFALFAIPPLLWLRRWRRRRGTEGRGFAVELSATEASA